MADGVTFRLVARYNAAMSDATPPKYTITDGTLVLDIYDAEEGGFAVQGTFDRALITQGDTLKEVFEMAHDAAEMLDASRRKDHEQRQRQERGRPALANA